MSEFHHLLRLLSPPTNNMHATGLAFKKDELIRILPPGRDLLTFPLALAEVDPSEIRRGCCGLAIGSDLNMLWVCDENDQPILNGVGDFLHAFYLAAERVDVEGVRRHCVLLLWRITFAATHMSQRLELEEVRSRTSAARVEQMLTLIVDHVP
ncbi:hypothetical protein KC338_g236 [Hortaea werneckii]|nr:hypothetical protein KC338_g236 [Hortaea werneckii]